MAGPFGLDKGQTKSSLDIDDPTEPSQVYTLRSVPKPHPAFRNYFAAVGEQSGLCRINAATETFDNDKYGSEARSKVEEIGAQLANVYGKSKSLDFIRSDGIWKGDDEWVMSIKQNERTYAKLWDAQSGAKLKDGLTRIGLIVRAASADEAFVVLEYDFDNIDACTAEAAKASEGSL